MPNQTIYAVLSINDFSLYLFTTKNQVADMVKCHRNTLKDISNRTTIGNYIIIPVSITKCKRGKH